MDLQVINVFLQIEVNEQLIKLEIHLITIL